MGCWETGDALAGDGGLASSVPEFLRYLGDFLCLSWDRGFSGRPLEPIPDVMHVKEGMRQAYGVVSYHM